VWKNLLENRRFNNNVNYGTYATLDADVLSSEDALRDATYFKCIKIISESIGKVGCNLKREKGNGDVREKENPLFNLVKKRPNPYMSSLDFFKCMEARRQHKGDSFALICRDRKGQVTGLYPIDVITLIVDNIGIAKTSKQNAILVQYTCGDSGIIYNARYDEVLHFKGFSMDAITSNSIKNILKDTIEINNSAKKYQKELFSNGLTNKCTVQMASDIRDEKKLNEAQELFNMMWSAKGRFITVPAGYKVDPLNISLADSQFKELKEMGAKQIASAFGVPQFMLNDLSDTNNNSLEMSNLHFLSNCLMVLFKSIELELEEKLLSEEDRRNGLYFEFNINELLRVDQKTQQEIITNFVRNGVYSINDARKLMGLLEIEGGNNVVLPSGYVTLKNLIDGTASYINKGKE